MKKAKLFRPVHVEIALSVSGGFLRKAQVVPTVEMLHPDGRSTQFFHVLGNEDWLCGMASGGSHGRHPLSRCKVLDELHARLALVGTAEEDIDVLDAVEEGADPMGAMVAWDAVASPKPKAKPKRMHDREEGLRDEGKVVIY